MTRRFTHVHEERTEKTEGLLPDGLGIALCTRSCNTVLSSLRWHESPRVGSNHRLPCSTRVGRNKLGAISVVVEGLGLIASKELYELTTNEIIT